MNDKIYLYLAQIIHTSNAITIKSTTPPEIPPAMYAKSDLSSQWTPMNEPSHRQLGFPLMSLTHLPLFSQNPSHKSVNRNVAPVYQNNFQSFFLKYCKNDFALTDAEFSSSIESWLTFAFEIARFWYE